ncbi:Histone H4 [Arthrobotrys musiformis]|uniref:Histone H4 n=1 Tax=Arthrobotrys musiformis TaxID=47236 RepID=A0AAV9W178_9PEZI
MPPGRDLAGRNAATRGPIPRRIGGMPEPRVIGSPAIATPRGASNTPTRPIQTVTGSQVTPVASRVFQVQRGETAGESSRSGAQGGGSAARNVSRQMPVQGPAPGRGRGSRGLGLATMRHKKFARDNIQGITRPSIRRLARRGGVKRISASIYEEARGILKKYLEKILKSCCMYTEHANRKTITTLDVVHALRVNGRTIYGFDDPAAIRSSKPRKKLAKLVARR